MPISTERLLQYSNDLRLLNSAIKSYMRDRAIAYSSVSVDARKNARSIRYVDLSVDGDIRSFLQPLIDSLLSAKIKTSYSNAGKPSVFSVLFFVPFKFQLSNVVDEEGRIRIPDSLHSVLSISDVRNQVNTFISDMSDDTVIAIYEKIKKVKCMVNKDGVCKFL